MATIFGHSPLPVDGSDQNTGEGFYFTDPNPATLLPQAGFAATGIVVGNQTDGSTPEVWARPAAARPDAAEVGILERSINRVVAGVPWTRSSWTKTEAIAWAAAHPAAQAFAVFKP